MIVSQPARPARSSPPPGGPGGPTIGRMTAGLSRLMAYQRPFRLRVASHGPVALAPVSVAYALITLVVSALWRYPGAGHRAVAACCAWRAAELLRGDLAPLFGSALLVRRLVQVVWTVTAVWLLLGPLEVPFDTGRLAESSMRRSDSRPSFHSALTPIGEGWTRTFRRCSRWD
jgi:hypothetical protein